MSAPPRPCVTISRDHWHYHIPVQDDSIETIEIEGVEYRRTLWQDPYGYPVFVPEGHDLLLNPPGSRRPRISDEQIEEHWRRVDSGELSEREFGEAMAAHNVDPLRLREIGKMVNPVPKSDIRIRIMQAMVGIQVLCLVAMVVAICWKYLRGS